jgi:opacity protein-like surface antigen
MQGAIMKRRVSTVGAVALLLLATTVQPARADWLLTPYLGAAFGGDTAKEQLTYGAAIGWMGAGVLGLEIDGGITPRFFDTGGTAFTDIEDSNVSTLMANIIVGAPLGAPGVRPYVTAGAGVLRARARSFDNVLDLDENHLGVNVGAGLIGFVTGHFGIRGDVRYFRRIQDSDVRNLRLDLDNFNFWRATVGGTLRF